MSEYELIPLIERKDLGRKCIELLNEEWPRSDGSREHSQAKSTRTSPPMSILLIHRKSDKLVGHARICNLPNRADACWIESVIVGKEERGKGLGKLLMLETESYIKRFGFVETFLSTEDKVEFYKCCGYVECEPVVHSTSATSVFPIFEKLQNNVEAVARPKPKPEEVAIISTSAPIPPPPPPVKTVSMGTMTTIDHQYMRKNI